MDGPRAGQVSGLIEGDGVVGAAGDDLPEGMVVVAQGAGVQNTGVDVDVVGDQIHHIRGGGVLGNLGAQGILIVDRLDDAVAGRGQGLQHGAHLGEAVARDGGGNGDDRELVVEQGVVAFLGFVVLGQGHHAVFLLHASHDLVLHFQDAEGGHGGFAVGEHLTDGVPDEVVAGAGDLVGGTVGVVEQVDELVGGAVEAVHVGNQGQVTILVLLDDVQLTGTPVAVDVGVGTADEAVQVARGVLLAVAVVLIEDGGQLGLLIQGPGAVLDVIIQVRLSRIGENGLIEDRNESEAVHGEHHRTQDGVLGAPILHGLVEALSPPSPIQVQVLAILGAEVVEGSTQGLGEGGTAGGGHDVVVLGAAFDGGSHLSDHGVDAVGVVRVVDDLDAQPLLHRLVALEDGVVDRLAGQALYGDFQVGPALFVAADDGDLVALVVEILGQVVRDEGGGFGLGGGVGIGGGFTVAVAAGAGGQGACEHDGGQERGQYAFGFHGILLENQFFAIDIHAYYTMTHPTLSRGDRYFLRKAPKAPAQIGQFHDEKEQLPSGSCSVKIECSIIAGRPACPAS